LTRIYTRTGDEGETGLLGGARVSKASDRVDAYGDIDELNCVIGLAHAQMSDTEGKRLLRQVQRQLMAISAELARPADASRASAPLSVSREEIERIEARIDALQKNLPSLKRLIVPGGCPEAAELQVIRAVCRRAERKLVALSEKEYVRPELIHYFNRLSDLLFAAARYANHLAGVEDPQWDAEDDPTTLDG